MSYGSILEQILQQGGLGGQNQTRQRVTDTAQNLETSPGIEGIFGQLQSVLGGLGGGAAGANAGGFADKARDFMREDQVGNLSGAAVGGIGALAGALLGGGVKGAVKGGAMAVLGTIAMQALQRARAGGGGAADAGMAEPGTGTRIGTPPVEASEVKTLVGPDSEKLVLRAMIAAAKADGHVDQAEMQKIVGKLGSDVSADERAFVLEEMSRPLDVQALARDVNTPTQAAQVYAASLLAIDIDSPAEREYLGQLARGLGLDTATVGELHKLTNAPA